MKKDEKKEEFRCNCPARIETVTKIRPGVYQCPRCGGVMYIGKTTYGTSSCKADNE